MEELSRRFEMESSGPSGATNGEGAVCKTSRVVMSTVGELGSGASQTRVAAVKC